MKLSTILGFFTLVFSFAAASPWHKRHHELSNRAPADVDVHKRFGSARFTYYDVGLGACGIVNQPYDMIVALNVVQFGPGYPGKHCFQNITISYNGTLVNATITDKCMGCPINGLDFSRGLFSILASEAVGVLYGEWWFNGGLNTLST